MTSHRPMLAVAGDPPRGPGWVSEFKWDGHRALASTGSGGPRLLSRGGHVVTARFPEITAALSAALGSREVVLDGELVVAGPDGVPDFERLQGRARATATPLRVARDPVTLVVFDLLVCDGVDVTGRPLRERRTLLEGLELENGPRVVCSPMFSDVDPDVLLGLARSRGLEGLVSKREDSAYAAGRRSKAWIKTVLTRRSTFTVAGWARGRSRRPDGVGSLLLGRPTGHGGLVYVGEVGTGWTLAEHARLVALLADLAVDECPFTENTAALPAGARFARPVVRGLVAYREHREGRLLRHPAWKGLQP